MKQSNTIFKALLMVNIFLVVLLIGYYSGILGKYAYAPLEGPLLLFRILVFLFIASLFVLRDKETGRYSVFPFTILSNSSNHLYESIYFADNGNNSSRYNDANAVFLVLAVPLILKTILSTCFPYPCLTGGDDEIVYLTMAEHLGKGQDFFAIMRRAPAAYPIILLPAFKLFPYAFQTYKAVQLTNIILASTSSIFIYFFLKRYLSNRASIIATIILSTIPSIMVLNMLSMSENLSTPLTITSFILFYFALEKRKLLPAFISSLLLGMTFSVRPANLGFIIPTMAVMLLVIPIDLSGLLKKYSPRGFLTKFAVIYLVTIVAMILLGNSFLYDSVSDSTTKFSVNDESLFMSRIKEQLVIFTPAYFSKWTRTVTIHTAVILASAFGFAFAPIICMFKRKYNFNEVLLNITIYLSLIGMVLTIANHIGNYIIRGVDPFLFGRYMDSLIPIMLLINIPGAARLQELTSTFHNRIIIFLMIAITMLPFIIISPITYAKFNYSFNLYIFLTEYFGFHYWTLFISVFVILLSLLSTFYYKKSVLILLVLLCLSSYGNLHQYIIRAAQNYYLDKETVINPINHYFFKNSISKSNIAFLYTDNICKLDEFYFHTNNNYFLPVDLEKAQYYEKEFSGYIISNKKIDNRICLAKHKNYFLYKNK